MTAATSTAPAVRAVRSAEHANYPCQHARLIVTDMEPRPNGHHLRVQRVVAGISARALASAAGWSETRVRSLEGSLRVTDRSTSRYLDALRAAWDRRAAEARAEEVFA